MGSSKEYKLAIKIAGEMEKSFYNSTRLTKKNWRRLHGRRVSHPPHFLSHSRAA